jgi:hypothetical protein
MPIGPPIGGSSSFGSPLMRGGRRARETYSEFLTRQVEQAQQDAAAARQMYEALAAQQPELPGAAIPGMAETGIQRLQAGGMSPAEYLAGRQRVTEGFQRATGQLGAGTARRGAYAPGSAATAAGGAPARGLATGLGSLEAQREEARRRSLQAGTQMAVQLQPQYFGAGRAGQEAFGDIAGAFRAARTYGRMGQPQTGTRPWAMLA